jgi:hypothetical protein
VSGSPPAQIEAGRECLLQSPHNRRELLPIGGLNVERQPFLIKPESAKLEDKALPRLAKHPAEDRYRLPPPE